MPSMGSKTLIVIGSAACAWDDLERALEMAPDAHIMAVNDIGMHIPNDIQHWYSNDVGMLINWKEARRPDYNHNIMLHSNNSGKSEAQHWPDVVGGNSAINAVLVGLELGYGRIIVCGVPLDGSGYYFSPPWIKTAYNNDCELDEWRRRVVLFDGRVKSMSGNTRNILNGANDD